MPVGGQSVLGLPGGKGPNKATEFALPRQPFADSAIIDVPRAPVFIESRRKGFISLDLIPNLLLTTLASVAIVPAFVPEDTAQQPHRKYNVYADVVPNLLTTTLAVVGSTPVTPVESAGISQRKLSQSTDVVPNQLVRGIPQPFPFGGDDWPQIQAKRNVSLDTALNLLTTTLAAVAAVPPFVPEDFAGSTKRPIPPGLFESVRNALPLGLPPAPFPFVQSEWPTSRAKYQVQVNDWPNLLNTTLKVVVGTNPFTATDTPSAPQRKQSYPDWQVSSLLTLGIPQQIPFSQCHWPLARVVQTTRTADWPNLLNTTLRFVAPLPVGRLLDWPIPIPAKPRVPDILNPGFTPDKIPPLSAAEAFNSVTVNGPGDLTLYGPADTTVNGPDSVKVDGNEDVTVNGPDSVTLNG